MVTVESELCPVPSFCISAVDNLSWDSENYFLSYLDEVGL